MNHSIPKNQYYFAAKLLTRVNTLITCLLDFKYFYSQEMQKSFNFSFNTYLLFEKKIAHSKGELHNFVFHTYCTIRLTLKIVIKKKIFIYYNNPARLRQIIVSNTICSTPTWKISK